MRKTVFLTLAILTVPLCFAGCGYHPPQTFHDDTPQKNISLYMELWENRTNEIGLESQISLALTDWLIQSNHFRLTSGADTATYTLKGAVLSVDYPGDSYDAFNRATALKARVTTSFRLTATESGNVVWQQENLVKESTYPVGSTAVMTQSNKKKALKSIADEIAENIYIRTYYAVTAGNRHSPAGGD